MPNISLLAQKVSELQPFFKIDPGGSSPYLQHYGGLGLAHWATRKDMSVPTYEWHTLQLYTTAASIIRVQKMWSNSPGIC